MDEEEIQANILDFEREKLPNVERHLANGVYNNNPDQRRLAQEWIAEKRAKIRQEEEEKEEALRIRERVEAERIRQEEAERADRIERERLEQGDRAITVNKWAIGVSIAAVLIALGSWLFPGWTRILRKESRVSKAGWTPWRIRKSALS